MKRKFYKPERLKEIATEISVQPLTTSQSRTGVEKKVDPTEEEKRIVYNIVYSALMSFNTHCYDGSGRILPEKEQAVCDCSETVFDMFTDWKYNGYTSLYCKLKDILEKWEVE